MVCPSVPESDSRSSRVTCTNGHALQPCHAETAQWICDRCQKDAESSAFIARHRCLQCNYNLCGSGHAWHGKASGLGHGDGALAANVISRVGSGTVLLDRVVLAAPRHGSSLTQATGHSMSRDGSMTERVVHALTLPKNDACVGCLTFPTMDVAPGGCTSAVAATHCNEVCVRLGYLLGTPLTHLQFQDLGHVYMYFDLVSARHRSMHGIACPKATYNQACCFSLAAMAFFAGILEDPAGLPPCSLTGGPRIAAELAEARLTYAVATLHKAVELGYSDLTNLLEDEALQTVRERVPERFRKLLQRVQWMRMRSAAGGA